jgi:hypothetical protein
MELLLWKFYAETGSVKLPRGILNGFPLVILTLSRAPRVIITGIFHLQPFYRSQKPPELSGLR